MEQYMEKIQKCINLFHESRTIVEQDNTLTESERERELYYIDSSVSLLLAETINKTFIDTDSPIDETKLQCLDRTIANLEQSMNKN